MPSYLVSAKESFVPVELYKAPVDALGETMRIKQQQYDQAFNQIAQNRSSMEGLEILGDDVKQLKQRYLSDAANKLKNLASVDLSIPQNVSEATKVFEPFYSDPVLMANAGRTAFSTSELAKLDAMQNSKDETIRDGYHPALKEYLFNDRKKIAEAGLDPTAYNNYQYRKAVPFINQQKFLQEQAKAEGLKVVHTDVNGPQLIEVENGKQSLKNYAAWAASKLNDTRFNEQYMILGTTQTERQYANMKTNPMYANYTESQLKQAHADNIVSQLETSFSSREKGLTARNAEINSELKTLIVPQGPPASLLEANALKRFESLKAELNSNQDQLTDVIDKKSEFTDSKKEDTKNLLLTNPGAYYASLARNADIMNFASGRASMEQVKISKNDAYWMDIKTQQDWKALAQRDTELQMRADGTYDQKSGSSSDGSSSGGSTGAGSINSGQYLGATSAPNVMENTAIDQYKRFMTQQSDIHTNSIWDPTTGLVSVAKTLGVSGEDIVAASTGWMKKSKDITYKFTDDEKAASAKLQTAFSTATGIKIEGPEGFTNAIYAYVKKYTDGLGSSRDYNQTDYTLMTSLVAAQKTGQTISSTEKERKRLINEVVAVDKKYSNLLIDDGAGKKRLIESKDIGETASYYLLYLDKKSNTYKKLTSEVKEAIGESYINGNNSGVEFNTQAVATGFGGVGIQASQYNTKKPFIKVNGQDVPLMYVGPDIKQGGEANQIGVVLNKKYGTAPQLKKLMQDVNENVISKSAAFKDMMGMMTPESVYNYDTRTTVSQETGVRIMQELTVPESINTVYAYNRANNKTEKPSAEDEAAVLNVIKGGEENIQKFFGPPRVNPYGGKSGSVSFTISPSITDKEISEKGLDAYKGKDIVFELNNISSMGPILKKLRVDQQFYVWNDLREGKPISSPEIMREGFNFGFKIIPTRSDSSATEAYTEFTFPVWEPRQGIYETKVIQTPTYPIKGDGAVDPDTRMNMTYAELFKQISLVTSRKNTQGGITGLDLLKR